MHRLIGPQRMAELDSDQMVVTGVAERGSVADGCDALSGVPAVGGDARGQHPAWADRRPPAPPEMGCCVSLLFLGGCGCMPTVNVVQARGWQGV